MEREREKGEREREKKKKRGEGSLGSTGRGAQSPSVSPGTGLSLTHSAGESGQPGVQQSTLVELGEAREAPAQGYARSMLRACGEIRRMTGPAGHGCLAVPKTLLQRSGPSGGQDWDPGESVRLPPAASPSWAAGRPRDSGRLIPPYRPILSKLQAHRTVPWTKGP